MSWCGVPPGVPGRDNRDDYIDSNDNDKDQNIPRLILMVMACWTALPVVGPVCSWRSAEKRVRKLSLYNDDDYDDNDDDDDDDNDDDDDDQLCYL